MKKKVRLSQCMIVKNEEKNIRRALSWGKDIVCEQIVVDTGSEDRTAEIAEQMGAKVFRFEWKNDFSAAKNFAIEQATGEWIAFLDADEYCAKEDVGKIQDFLYEITYHFTKGQKPPEIVRSPLLNLNDTGEIFSTTVQDRFFRNFSYIRYKNRIHEVLSHTGGRMLRSIREEHFSIYHTGYANSVYRETNKLERNIEILEAELAEHPEDYDVWSYLGDSLLANGQRSEAEEAYRKAVEHADKIHIPQRRNTAYSSLMRIIAERRDTDAEKQLRSLYEEFRQFHEACPDMEYWLGAFLFQSGKFVEAIYWLELTLNKLEGYKGRDVLFASGNLEQIYECLACAFHKTGDIPQTVRYSTLVLRKNRFHENACLRIIRLFMEDKATDAGQVYQFLDKIYNFSDIKEKLYILKQAKKISYTELEDKILNTMTKEEKDWLNQGEDYQPWNLSISEMQVRYPEITINNRVDFNFLALMQYVGESTEEMLAERMKNYLLRMKEKNRADYLTTVKAFELFTIWGRLLPDEGVYEAFERRAYALKHNREDFLWLYENLGDYRSKQTLYGILENWAHLEKRILTIVKDSGLPFFDLDLISYNGTGGYVDIGTYKGESLQQFLYYYGNNYQRIDCFETAEEAIPDLSAIIGEQENIILHTVDEESGIIVDKEISVPVEVIKINVRGAASGVLDGCAGHIRNEHPKLAICIDYGCEEIYKIPKEIIKLDDTYRFYIRYYGENLIPTKCILYAV